MSGKINGLDLFSGIGGISMALAPWVQTVGYVEIDPYAQAVLQTKIRAGELDFAAIWDDVRSFDPRQWKGKVDIITAGFPCQDISVAGHGKGLAGKRSGLFFQVIRIAWVIRPAFIFLENTPGIYTPKRGGSVVIRTLAALGYDTRWICLAANEVGSSQKRERFWCLAHRYRSGGDSRTESTGREEGADPGRGGAGAELVHSKSHHGGLHPRSRGEGPGTAEFERRSKELAHNNKKHSHISRSGAGDVCGQFGEASEIFRGQREMGHSNGAGSQVGESQSGNNGAEQSAIVGTSGRVPYPPGRNDPEGWKAYLEQYPGLEPAILRGVDGIPHRSHRIRCIGNSVDPYCAREAFKQLLWGRIDE